MKNTRKPNIIALVCMIGLVLNNSMALALQQPHVAPKGPITYAELGNKIISAYGVVSEKPNAPKDEKEEAKLDIQELTEQQKRKIVFDVLSRYENNNKESQNDAYQEAIYDAQRLVIDDIELFFARDAQDHTQNIFSTINYTETISGEAALADKLAHPRTNVKKLRQGQAFIAELVNNEELFNECQELVVQLKKAEPALYSFYSEDNKATQDLIDALYPSPEKGIVGKVFGGLNKSAPALEAYTRLGNLGTGWQICGDYVMIGAEFYIAKKLYDGFGIPVPMFKDSFFDNVKAGFNILWPIGYFKTYYNLGKNEPYTLNVWGTDKILAAPGVRAEDDMVRKIFRYGNLGSGTMMSGLLAYKAYIIKEALKAANTTRKTANLLQARLIGAGSFISGVKQVEALGEKHTALRDGLDTYSDIAPLLNGRFAQSPEFKDLAKTLQTNTFKGEASFFSYTGRVLATYKMMQDNRDNIAPVLKIVGELDAYLSIAKMLKKSADQRAGYCFVEYVDGITPYIKLDEFWNPQVDPSVVVTNSIELGAPGKVRNIILTGSNTGGKSTILKALTFDVLLAQTFGVACAKRMVLTPFTYFGSSMNIVDNTAQGKSLYQAEVDRAAGLINTARETHRRGGLSFIIMDELFRGTGPEKADQETYMCAKHLYNLDSNSFILATHYFNNPLKLEQETNGICKNYKVDAYIDENGKIVRTFTLEEGISMNNIAGSILDAALKK